MILYDDVKHVLIYSYMAADAFGSRVVIKCKNFDEMCMQLKEGLCFEMVLNAVTLVFSFMRQLKRKCILSSRTSHVWPFCFPVFSRHVIFSISISKR